MLIIYSLLETVKVNRFFILTKLFEIKNCLSISQSPIKIESYLNYSEYCIVILKTHIIWN